MRISPASRRFDRFSHRERLRRTQSFAAPQAETGMVPLTTNRVVHEEPMLERGTVMRADGADCEDFVTAPCEKGRFTVRVP